MIRGENPKHAISRTWEEGRYLDLWSFVHLISGSIMAIIISLFGFSFLVSLIISVLLMTLWEIFERVVGIYEVWENQVMDVVVGVFGFVPTFLLVPSDRTVTFIILIILLIIVATLDYLGWQAFERRKN